MMTFPVGEGTAPGYLALPTDGEGPGVLVLHAWWGLNEFFQDFCERLAREGFVALAPDLYHGHVAVTIEEAERLAGGRDREQARADSDAAVTYLRQHPAVKRRGLGCVGFSMGGSSAYDLSRTRSADIAAVVAFYGGGDPEADYSAARAAYLGQYVEQDEWEPEEYITPLESKLRADGREVTFDRYAGVTHWFMEHNRPDAYQAETARVAWGRTIEFLHRQLEQA
jgi:carboxymethylenebutenolidase